MPFSDSAPDLPLTLLEKDKCRSKAYPHETSSINVNNVLYCSVNEYLS